MANLLQVLGRAARTVGRVSQLEMQEKQPGSTSRGCCFPPPPSDAGEGCSFEGVVSVAYLESDGGACGALCEYTDIGDGEDLFSSMSYGCVSLKCCTSTS